MSESGTLELDVKLRAWAIPTPKPSSDNESSRRKQKQKPGFYPEPGEREIIVFDTETEIDLQQRLRFGGFRRYREVLCENVAGSKFSRLACFSEGFFYRDDLPQTDPEGFRALETYVSANKPAHDPDWAAVEPVINLDRSLLLFPVSRFVEDIIYQQCYKRKSPLVGLNLPFDISRIARGFTFARNEPDVIKFHFMTYTDDDGKERRNKYRPEISVKPLDNGAFISFAKPMEPDALDLDENGRAYRGEFVELGSVLHALTGKRQSLASGGREMGCEVQKGEADYAGPITGDFIDYLRADLALTGELYEKCRIELERHPIDLPMHRVYSPASVGRAYYRAMGIRPRLDIQPDFPKDQLGAAMASFYGGRVEAQILGDIPVRYLDVMSMYPAVCALTDVWGYDTAKSVSLVPATARVRELLKMTTDELYNPEKWRDLVGFARLGDIDPNQMPILPVRGDFHKGDSSIGLCKLAEPHDGWYQICDLMASKVLTGYEPPIVEAYQLVASDKKQKMRSVKFRGESSFNPRKDDFFRALVEMRHELKSRSDATEQQKARGYGAKITVNSLYGMKMHIDRDQRSVYTPMDIHTGTDEFIYSTKTPESPGTDCFPPLGALITAGARLVLAIIERAVKDAGGTLAYCDTDSAMIVATQNGGLIPCPGGPETLPDGEAAVRALSYSQVETIAERFVQLSPYDIPGKSILELEVENRPDENKPGSSDELRAFILGKKRYVLYNLAPDGRVIIRSYVESGIGTRMNPEDPLAPPKLSEDETETIPLSSGKRRWIETLWLWLIETNVLKRDVPEPAWFDQPAFVKLPLASKDIIKKTKLWPFNFAMQAPPALLETFSAAPRRLIAPFVSNPRKWGRLKFTNIYDGKRYFVEARQDIGWVPDTINVASYREMADQYLTRQQLQLQTPDGRPCPRGYRGLLHRRVVVPGRGVYIGKEGTHIDDVAAGLLTQDEVVTEYEKTEISVAQDTLRQIIGTFSPTAVKSECDVSMRSLVRLWEGKRKLSRRSLNVIHTWAFNATGRELRAYGRAASRDPARRFEEYLQVSAKLRVCQYPPCEVTLSSRHLKYCSRQHRKAHAKVKARRSPDARVTRAVAWLGEQTSGG